MALEIKVPNVGESISEVTISQWMKKTGDIVEMDEVIAELESDKATFELTAEAAGQLTTKAEEGDTIEIGAVICEIDTDAADSAAPDEKAKTESAPTQSEEASPTGETKEMHVPAVGESINEVTISSWMVADGESVALDDVIAEIESDKATFELTAEANGVLEHVAKEGDTLEIGALICKIKVTDGAPAKKAASEGSSQATEIVESPTGEPGYAAGHASPAAAKILAEKGMSSS
ncbi:MAG: biotin/lipoyl-containing protein, partial [Cyclobacteriaceae bacterium]